MKKGHKIISGQNRYTIGRVEHKEGTTLTIRPPFMRRVKYFLWRLTDIILDFAIMWTTSMGVLLALVLPALLANLYHHTWIMLVYALYCIIGAILNRKK